MIYVASPYSDLSPVVREARYWAVRKWTMNKIKDHKHSLFSPIAYMHEYADAFGMPYDAKFWYDFNYNFIQCAKEMWVLKLDGWDKSEGVKVELNLARFFDKPVFYFDESE